MIHVHKKCLKKYAKIILIFLFTLLFFFSVRIPEVQHKEKGLIYPLFMIATVPDMGTEERAHNSPISFNSISEVPHISHSGIKLPYYMGEAKQTLYITG